MATVTRAYVSRMAGLTVFDPNGDLVGKECARTGKNVREVVLEMGLLSEAGLDEIFSPENLMRPQYRGRVYAAEVPDEPVLAGAR